MEDPAGSNPEVERSLQYSIRDSVAYAVMTGGAEAYLSAFALYCAATTAQIGWLVALPPLIGSMAQPVSAWLGRRASGRRPVILLGARIQALTWLPIGVLPYLYGQASIPYLIAAVVFYHAAANLTVPQWTSLMGDLVPEERRGRFFARRTALGSLTSFSSLVLAGLILHGSSSLGHTGAGYLLLFGIAMTARFISARCLGRMLDPPGKVAVLELPGREWFNFLRDSPAVRFSIFHASFQAAVAISSPFFVIYMLRDLKFSYLEFMTNSAAMVMVQFLTLQKWGQISDHFGNRKVLVVTGTLIPLLPLLWTFSTGFWYLILVQFAAGLAWAGYSLSAGNILYDLVPPERRVSYLAFHGVMVNVGVFLGAMAGGYLGLILPKEIHVGSRLFTWTSALYGVFFASSAARALVALIFLRRVKEVRTVRPITVSRLIFRVTRVYALAGLVFDVVGTPRKKRKPAARTKLTEE